MTKRKLSDFNSNCQEEENYDDQNQIQDQDQEDEYRNEEEPESNHDEDNKRSTSNSSKKKKSKKSKSKNKSRKIMDHIDNEDDNDNIDGDDDDDQNISDGKKSKKREKKEKKEKKTLKRPKLQPLALISNQIDWNIITATLNDKESTKKSNIKQLFQWLIYPLKGNGDGSIASSKFINSKLDIYDDELFERVKSMVNDAESFNYKKLKSFTKYFENRIKNIEDPLRNKIANCWEILKLVNEEKKKDKENYVSDQLQKQDAEFKKLLYNKYNISNDNDNDDNNGENKDKNNDNNLGTNEDDAYDTDSSSVSNSRTFEKLPQDQKKKLDKITKKQVKRIKARYDEKYKIIQTRDKITNEIKKWYRDKNDIYISEDEYEERKKEKEKEKIQQQQQKKNNENENERLVAMSNEHLQKLSYALTQHHNNDSDLISSDSNSKSNINSPNSPNLNVMNSPVKENDIPNSPLNDDDLNNLSHLD
jgi:hypothetical protein